jgi:hypothetical protein
MSDKMIQLPLPFEEPMDNYTAVGIAEGFIASSSGEEYLRAWQHLIDTGMAYQLQGWFGRTANQLIEEGHCTAPTTNTQPYSC